jgi:hypothetical protein
MLILPTVGCALVQTDRHHRTVALPFADRRKCRHGGHLATIRGLAWLLIVRTLNDSRGSGNQKSALDWKSHRRLATARRAVMADTTQSFALSLTSTATAVRG